MPNIKNKKLFYTQRLLRGDVYILHLPVALLLNLFYEIIDCNYILPCPAFCAPFEFYKFHEEAWRSFIIGQREIYIFMQRDWLVD